MTLYAYHQVLVWDAAPGGVMRLLRNGAVTVKSWPAGDVVDTLTSDAQGQVDFTATDVGAVTVTSPNGLQSAPIIAAELLATAASFVVSEDAAVAALVADSGSSTAGAVDATVAAAVVPKLTGVAQTTAPDPSAGVWVDTGATVDAPTKWRRDTDTAALAAPFNIALGADPEPYSDLVFKNGTNITDISVAGTTLTINSGVVEGDTVRVQFAYKSDSTAAASNYPTTLVKDSFTRANSAVTMGSTTETSHAWTALAGTWGITSNQAYLVTNATSNDCVVVDAGAADVTVQAKVVTVAGSQGLAVRVTDADNVITTNLTGMFRRTGGVNTAIGTFSSAFVAGDTMRIVTSGTSIKTYRQAASTGTFELVLSVTESQGSTNTKHGLRQSSAAGGAWDDFRVVGA